MFYLDSIIDSNSNNFRSIVETKNLLDGKEIKLRIMGLIRIRTPALAIAHNSFLEVDF